jgi:eukaryotic-like serine/threonine-protein kinase
MDIEQFAALLVRSRLTTEQEAKGLVAAFQQESREAASTADTLTAFCNHLIACKRITAWQCEKLRMGKWKGFYLDHYLLLEQVGKDVDYAYYAARDTRDGTLVRLAITPVARTQGWEIEYRVERYSE